MTRRLAGAVASCLVLLTGLWLILAPFALGIQPENSDWKDETFTDVWSGIGLAVVGLIGLIVFAAALMQSLRDRGLMTSEGDRQPAGDTAQSPEPSPAPGSPAAAPSPAPSDLDKLLSPLVQALTEDLNRERGGPADHQSVDHQSGDHQSGDHQPAENRPAGGDPTAPVNRAAAVTNNGSQRQAVADQREA